MKCLHCFEIHGLLIRGFCVRCRPDLHSDHEKRLQIIGEASDAFRSFSGKDALEEWSAFERFTETDMQPKLRAAYIQAFDQ